MARFPVIPAGDSSASLPAGLVGGAGSKWAEPGALARTAVVEFGIALYFFLINSEDRTVYRCRHEMNWFHRQVCGSGLWRRRLERELLDWALNGAQLGDDVLEIGPGAGVTTDLLRGRTERLTALEVEATAAAALQRRLEGSGVRVILGDGAAMPFEDCSFSGVVSLTMLHHVPTAVLQDRLFAEARRVLRPGGFFVGLDGVGSLVFRLVHLGDTYMPVNPDTLGRRLEAAGFTDVAVERGQARFRFRASRGTVDESKA